MYGVINWTIAVITFNLSHWNSEENQLLKFTQAYDHYYGEQLMFLIFAVPFR